ncbi:MAG: disulfide bond formation protein B [Steroidobacteraceae bacterium]
MNPLLARIFTDRRTGNFVGFLVCAGLIAYALYSQYGLGFEPCPLCIFQRVAVMAIGVIFLLAALHHPHKTGALIYGALGLLAALIGVAIAARHVWIQAQPPGTVAACGATLDYMLDILPVFDVITKVLTGSGECAEITWTLLGLSMPWWVIVACVGLGLWAIWVNMTAPALLIDRRAVFLKDR